MAIPGADRQAIRRAVDMHALYRMYDKDGRLLYVGCTGNAGRRIGEHASKRWFPLVATIKLEWFPAEAAALLAERRAIRQEHPRYNIAGISSPHIKRSPLMEQPEVAVLPVPPEPETDRGCGDELMSLLEKGTSASEVAAALDISKWHARQRLERLREDGIAKVQGVKRAAKWRLVSPTGKW